MVIIFDNYHDCKFVNFIKIILTIRRQLIDKALGNAELHRTDWGANILVRMHKISLWVYCLYACGFFNGQMPKFQ